MRVALVQLNSGDQPEANLAQTTALIAKAAAGGADFIVTPEVTNCVSTNRRHQKSVLRHDADDPTLKAICGQAQNYKVWILIGSLALLSDDPDGRFVNRSFLIDPQGGVYARYDKIHMFDVAVTKEETFSESAGYRPGATAVLAETEFGCVGMTICYDLRFGGLYRDLANAGAEILTIPSAFSPVTGAAHWHTLLKARAIETGCFVLAPAQCGFHASQAHKPRRTFGHSLAISPWGEVLVEAGDEPCVAFAEINLSEVQDARHKIPSIFLNQPYNLVIRNGENNV